MKFRPFTLDDAPRVAELLNVQEVSQWTSFIPFPYTQEDAEKWIIMHEDASVRKPLAIEVNRELVGCISCWLIDEKATEVGYWVGKPYWGQGIASKALSLFLQRQDFPKTSRVIAKVVNHNIGSQSVLRKNGFKAVDTCEISRNDEVFEAIFFVKERSL